MTAARAREAAQALRVRWPLLLIMAGFVLISLAYNAATPPYEGPDEPQHFAYVLYLAEQRAFPPQGEAAWETPVQQEASQPPLYYLLASLPAHLLNLDDPPATFRPNPNFVGPFPRDFPDNDNRAIHYPGQRPPLAGGWLAFYLARGVSTLFGLLLLAAVYHLAREVWPADRRRAWLCTLFVAAIPQVIFLGSVVSNDIPVAALSTLTLWRLAVLLRSPQRLRHALLAGLCLGLAVLTKVSAFTLVMPIALALLWLWRSGRQTPAQLLRTAFWLGLAAFLVAGWWFVRSWILYGSPLGLETHDAAAWAIAGVEQPDEAWRRWWEVFRSFWIWLGWGTVRPPFRAYHILFVLSLLAVPGLLLTLRRWLAARQSDDELSATQRRSAVLVVLLSVALLSVVVFLEIWMHRVVATYGRLLYPALGAVAIFLIAGWSALHPRLPLLPIAFLLALALLGPVAIIPPAYAAPRGLSAAELEALRPAHDLRFGRTPETAFAQLIQVEPLQRSVDAGALAPIRVCWRTLGPADADHSVLVQIVGPENEFAGGRTTYPGLGRYPTSSWDAGVHFCDLVQVLIRKDLQRTLVYNVEVAMLDGDSRQRLPIYDAAGNPWEVAFVEKIRVEAGDAAQAPLNGEGPALQLIAHDIEGDVWRPGQRYGFTLTWAAKAPVDVDYQLFVHLRHPQTGEPVAQADGRPLDGWYPTSWWPVGEVIVDERGFDLPDDVPPGTFDLVVGFYDLVTQQRFGPDYHLETITVLP